MRGKEQDGSELFSYISLEQRVPQDHPLRTIRGMTDRVFEGISAEFSKLYAERGRRSIPPEQLLRALLLQVFFSVRSERQLREQLDYNLLFRWFVGLRMDDVVWDASTFSKNRERLLQGDIARVFFRAVLEKVEQAGLLSNEHFTVDGTLIEAWASEKSFQRRPDPPEKGSGARGKRLLHDEFASATDPDARKFKKSKYGDAKLCHLAHTLMDNRHGLVRDACVTQATTGAERDAALHMLQELGRRRITLGADKAYDDREFIARLRAMGVTPHVAQYQRRTTYLDGRTTRHAGYAKSLEKRSRIEQIFSWLKNVAVLRKTRHRGRERLQWMVRFALTAYNLVRMRNLMAQSA
jgi:transposase